MTPNFCAAHTKHDIVALENSIESDAGSATGSPSEHHDHAEELFFSSLTLAAEVIFILDIILNFRTGYIEEETDTVWKLLWINIE